MEIAAYVWNGLQHALFGVCLAVLFHQMVSTRYLFKGDYWVGLIMSSSALFFLPAHLTRSRTLIDWLYQFLHYPLADWDILLLGIRWHRFFITHALFIPALFLLFWLHAPERYYRFAAGLSVGMSSHLIWDALTCSRYTPIIFLRQVLEIRGYLAKGWLLAHGLLLFLLVWFVTVKFVQTRIRPHLER
jgi:hypothetical protein